MASNQQTTSGPDTCQVAHVLGVGGRVRGNGLAGQAKVTGQHGWVAVGVSDAAAHQV
jgi:hypothetical protein